MFALFALNLFVKKGLVDQANQMHFIGRPDGFSSSYHFAWNAYRCKTRVRKTRLGTGLNMQQIPATSKAG
jgi:hypothetical protein